MAVDTLDGRGRKDIEETGKQIKFEGRYDSSEPKTITDPETAFGARGSMPMTEERPKPQSGAGPGKKQKVSSKKE